MTDKHLCDTCINYRCGARIDRLKSFNRVISCDRCKQDKTIEIQKSKIMFPIYERQKTLEEK